MNYYNEKYIAGSTFYPQTNSATSYRFMDSGLTNSILTIDTTNNKVIANKFVGDGSLLTGVVANAVFTGGTIAGTTNFTSNLNVGNNGSEGSSVNINGTLYDSTLKISDIDGSNWAQTILHRHSTVLEPMIVGARSNSDTSAHTNVTANMNTFSIYGAGWYNNAYKLNGEISISTDDTGSQSNTSSPGKIVFSTTPDGSIWSVPAMTIRNNKNVEVGGSVSATTFIGSGDNLSITKLYNILNYGADYTGWYGNDTITETYDPATRKITLSGSSFALLYKGEIILNYLTGGTWTSDAHNTGQTSSIYLKYNTNGFSWTNTVWTFDEGMIGFVAVDHNNTILYCVREIHGLMDYETHQELHQTLGTYKISGADISAYVLASTTAANRRPTISSTVIKDEDLQTTLAAQTGSYTQFYLTSTGFTNFNTGSTDIVPLLANNPYYNNYTGGAWIQTLFPNNAYGALFLVGVPVTSDAGSQVYRYMWVQPQSQSTTLATIQALTPSSLNLGSLPNISNEYVFLAKIIIRFAATNWTFISVESLTGTRYNQVSVVAGSFLSSVSTDTTLTGDGTIGLPLGVNTTLIVNSVSANTFNNIAMGIKMINNTFVGSNNMTITTTAITSNTSYGYNALKLLTAANNNVSIGTSAQENNSTGANNTAVGTSAIASNVSGNNNVGIGLQALYTNKGTGSVAVGANSLFSLDTSGDYNTAIGYYTGFLKTSGFRNIYLGQQAGYNATTASNELYIDSQENRGTNALEKANSIIYGIMGASATAQTLKLNANTTVAGTFVVNGITTLQGLTSTTLTLSSTPATSTAQTALLVRDTTGVIKTLDLTSNSLTPLQILIQSGIVANCALLQSIPAGYLIDDILLTETGGFNAGNISLSTTSGYTGDVLKNVPMNANAKQVPTVNSEGKFFSDTLGTVLYLSSDSWTVGSSITIRILIKNYNLS